MLIRFKRYSKGDPRDQIKQIEKNVGLNENELVGYPNEFSGGRRQRIVIIRGLVLESFFTIFAEHA